MFMKNLFKYEGDNGGGGASDPVNPDPIDPNDPPADPEPTDPATEPDKTEAKDTLKEFLKSSGFNSTEEVEAIIQANKEAEEAKKTAEQRQAEALEAAKKEADTYKTQAETLEAKNAALANGVKAESVDDVVALAKLREGEDIAENIKAVLEAYPHFGVSAVGPGEKRRPAVLPENPTNKTGKLDGFLQGLGIKEKE